MAALGAGLTYRKQVESRSVRGMGVSMRFWIMALVLACGSRESPNPETTTQSAETPEARQVEDLEDPQGAESSRTNRSAGPARARFAVMAVRAFSAAHVIAPFARKVAVGGSDGNVAIFDVPSGRVRAARRVSRYGITTLLPSADGQRILVLGTTNPDGDCDRAAVWDLETDEVWYVPEGTWVEHAALNLDGTQFALVRNDPARVIFGEVRGAIHEHAIEPNRRSLRVVFSNDGGEVVVLARHVHRFDTRTGRRRGTPWELMTRGEVALSPTHVAVASSRSTSAQVWSVTEGELVADIDTRGPRSAARESRSRARWSPDGSILVVDAPLGGFQLFGGEDFSMMHEGDDRLSYRPVDFRGNILRWASLDESGATLHTTETDAEPIRFELGREMPRRNEVTGFPESDSHFFFAAGGDVYIANIALQRARRLARGGLQWGEFSTWDVEFSARGIRAGDAAFGSVAVSAVRREAPDQSVQQHAHLASGSGHTLRIANASEEEDLGIELLVAGGTEPIQVSAHNFELYCDSYQPPQHDGPVAHQWICGVRAWFAPDGDGFMVTSVVEGDTGVASYDLSGRRMGYIRRGSAHYGRDGQHIVVRKPDGGLVLTGPNLRTTATIMRGRAGHRALHQFNESSSLFVASRGAALIIHDVAGNARKHAITLDGVPRVAPRFVDDDRLVQVQLSNAFIWYSVEDGSETRRVDLEDIRGMNMARDAAVYCSGNRLRHRVLASEQSTDLGPCPEVDSVRFDDARAWWNGPSIVNLVRFSDGQRLHLARVPGRRPLSYAYTPEGKVWVSDPSRLAALGVRMDGPLLEAELGEVTETMLTSDLVERFVAGRPL